MVKRFVALLIGLLVGVGAAQGTELHFQHAMGGPLGEALEALVARYNSAQDEVVIRSEHVGGYDELLQKTLAQLAAGESPAIVQLDGYHLPRIAASGRLLDLGPRLRGEHRALYDDLFPAFREQITTPGGEVYALPFNNSLFVLYYNPELLERAGVEPPRTYAELQEVAGRITRATGMPAMAFKSSAVILEAAVYSNGGELLGPAGLTLDTPEVAEVVALWNDMIQEGTATVGGSGEQMQQDFATGNVAMFADTVVASRFMRESVPFAFGVAPLPHFGTPVTTVGGASLAIFNTLPEAEQAAAWDFLTWLAEPAQQLEWVRNTNYVPIRRAATETPAFQALMEDNDAVRVAVSELPNARPRPSHPSYPQAEEEIVSALERIFLQGAPIQDTLAALSQETARLFR